MILPLIIIIIIIVFVLRQKNKSSKTQSPKGCSRPPKPPAACGHVHDSQAASTPAQEPSTADYHEFMVNSEIAPSVIDSHNSFVKDLVTTTTGASAASVKSNAEYDNKPWGLPRSTVYIPISENSRTTSSATTEVLKDEYAGNVYGIL